MSSAFDWTAYKQAERFIGLREIPGQMNSPQIMAMLHLDVSWPKADEIAWCSAFANYVAWLLNLTRSKSLRARSWLWVGRAVELADARAAFDVVILKRGRSPQPGAAVLKAPGHVGFYSGRAADRIHILGGNQSNMVSVASFPLSRVLGVRRLWE